MSGLTVDSLRSAITKISPYMAKYASELNHADSKLGDGDLGITMERGMAGLNDIADDLPQDVGLAFMQCAKEFTRVSGSSFGTLFATGLMSAAKTCKGSDNVPWSQIASIISSANNAMMKRGKGKLGNKTVLDPLDAIAHTLEGMNEPNEMLKASRKAICETMNQFLQQKSELGRARMYGEKSIGLDDPGMLALQKLVQGLLE